MWPRDWPCIVSAMVIRESGELLTVPRSAKVFTYSAEHEPACTVAPGERFVVQTTSAFGEFDLRPGDTAEGLARERCDPLTGPIAVAGAQPGDVLEVHIEDVTVEGEGLQAVLPGGGVLDWPTLPLVFHPVRDGQVVFPGGLLLDLQPMIGCIGVAPQAGPIESVLPGDHGGNLDTRQMCAGSIVELPVFHEGALLFLGDCHQLQGDGELCGVAPETDAVLTLRCTVRSGGPPIARPRVRAADRIHFLASAPTLEDAARIATQDLVDALVQMGLEPDDAYFLVTVKADLEISQVVNDLRTVRVAMDLPFFGALASRPGR
jgi:amidase